MLPLRSKIDRIDVYLLLVYEINQCVLMFLYALSFLNTITACLLWLAQQKGGLPNNENLNISAQAITTLFITPQRYIVALQER